MKYFLIIFALSFSASAAEFPDMSAVKHGQKVHYSEDGVVWYPANFAFYSETRACPPVEVIEGEEFPPITLCDGVSRSVGIVWNEPPSHPDGMNINYVRPEILISRAEMFGLLTRLENMLSSDDVGFVSRSFSSLITDRAEMLKRVTAMREALK